MEQIQRWRDSECMSLVMFLVYRSSPHFYKCVALRYSANSNGKLKILPRKVRVKTNKCAY